ncbi:hypothetical protein TcWFU_010384 [Taenia crassiceps]|uniref:G-protein coupled receptors family 1 profile domain-containing protein n=1 Tax=Taenia crassiceps TaxID=6207 RepID=A0ABR4QF39_9CEST
MLMQPSSNKAAEDIIAVPISGSLNFSVDFTSNDTSPEPAGVSFDTSKNVVKILLTAVACLGLVTNCMIVIVLTQLRGSHPVGGGERSARFNLLGLAIADFCICLSTLPLIYSKRTYKRSDIMLYYTLFGPGLVSTFLTVSAWMVVLVSILRSVICAIVSIYLAAFIFNFPLFLQYDYEEIDPFEHETPITSDVKNHQRHKRPAEPSPLYHERNLLSPHIDLQQQFRLKPESSDSAKRVPKEAEQIELQMQEGLK